VANFGDESIRDERINRAVSHGEDNKKKKKKKTPTRPQTRSVFLKLKSRGFPNEKARG
jgi:hypothetical protein